MTEIQNYEKSYKSLWSEVERARRERDKAKHLFDAVRDLSIALRHDMGTGTKVSYDTHAALNRIDSIVVDLDPR